MNLPSLTHVFLCSLEIGGQGCKGYKSFLHVFDNKFSVAFYGIKIVFLLNKN